MQNSQAKQVLARNGKSFYWASLFLGSELADRAARLYQFCRFVDDLADGDLPDSQFAPSLLKITRIGKESPLSLAISPYRSGVDFVIGGRASGSAVGPASAAAVWRTVATIGGDNGYYCMDWLWWIRGVMDWLVGISIEIN